MDKEPLFRNLEGTLYKYLNTVHYIALHGFQWTDPLCPPETHSRAHSIIVDERSLLTRRGKASDLQLQLQLHVLLLLQLCVQLQLCITITITITATISATISVAITVTIIITVKTTVTTIATITFKITIIITTSHNNSYNYYYNYGYSLKLQLTDLGKVEPFVSSHDLSLDFSVLSFHSKPFLTDEIVDVS